MSTLTTHTTASRDSHSIGLCKFNTTSNAIEVSDGSNWQVYNTDTVTGWSGSNTYSLNFDGTDDYLSSSSVITSTATAGTVTAWVKTSVTSGSQFVLTQTDKTAIGNNVYISFSLSGQLARIQWANGGTVNTILGDQTLAANTWHHIMWVSTGTAYKIYTNGTENTLTVSLGSNNGNWFGDATGLDTSTIGCQDRNSGRVAFFNGNIDELAVWDSDQSSNISTIYNSGSPGNLLSLNPKAWWRMGDGAEDGSGTTIYDMSLFSNNLTIVNATSGTNSAGAVYQSDTP